MYTLKYLYSRNYRLLPNIRASIDSQPAIQVVLSKGNSESPVVFAIVDSGAEYCLFSFSIGNCLGIDVFTGEEIRLSSLGSVEPIKAYLHHVELEVLTYEGEIPWRFQTCIAFSSSDIPRNILGREGFFKYALVGFVEMEQKIYLSPYS